MERTAAVLSALFRTSPSPTTTERFINRTRTRDPKTNVLIVVTTRNARPKTGHAAIGFFCCVRCAFREIPTNVHVDEKHRNMCVRQNENAIRAVRKPKNRIKLLTPVVYLTKPVGRVGVSKSFLKMFGDRKEFTVLAHST